MLDEQQALDFGTARAHGTPSKRDRETRKSEAEHRDDGPDWQALVPYTLIDAIVAQRDAALEGARCAHQAVDKAVKALAVAAEAFATAADGHGHFSSALRTGGYSRTLMSAECGAAPEAIEHAVRRGIDAAVWHRIMDCTRLRHLMDRTAKDAMRAQLERDPPEITRENIEATVQAMAADAQAIFRRGIAACFTRLDRRFRSHDGFKIGSRIILSDVFDEYGSWRYRGGDRDTLLDVERTLRILDGRGRELGENESDIVRAIDAERTHWRVKCTPCTVESEYAQVRIFGNGNCHLWFTRPDLVDAVNRELAAHYGATLGDASSGREQRAHSDAAGPSKSMARRHGFFATPEKIARLAVKRARIAARDGDAPTVLEPSAGDGAIARCAAEAGGAVDCIEIQSGLAERLRNEGRYRSVREADFLTVTPEPRYARIVMNPPFDGGLDIAHVEHALRFLEAGGRLVAIMSAGTEFRRNRQAERFRATVEAKHGQWIDLPEGAFAEAGTQVNTVMVVMNEDGTPPQVWP